MNPHELALTRPSTYEGLSGECRVVNYVLSILSKIEVQRRSEAASYVARARGREPHLND